MQLAYQDFHIRYQASFCGKLHVYWNIVKFQIIMTRIVVYFAQFVILFFLKLDNYICDEDFSY